MNTATFSQEIDRLNAQIEPIQAKVVAVETELQSIECELDSYAVEQQQYGILKNVCDALDELKDLGAEDLFWKGLPETVDSAAHSRRLKGRITDFSEQTRELEEKKASLKEQLEQHMGVLDYLFDEINQAQMREERRLEEFAIEREFVPPPSRAFAMPWVTDKEDERFFRRSVLVALLWCLIFGGLVPLVNIPLPDRDEVVTEVPERFAMLLKEELPPPAPEVPVVERPETEKPEEPARPEQDVKEVKKQEQKTEPKTPTKKKEQKPAGGKKGSQKARNVGVLAFKSSFSDLMDEVPVATLGAQAKLKKTDGRVPGQARASRSLVSVQGEGGGGQGISNFGVSRNLGNGGSGGGNGYGNAGQIGGVGTAKVESSMSGLQAGADRPLSAGVGPSRTDEEIQIVFDRYKATLYRIYNRELRKDPTLRGQLLLKLSIEPDGEVSLCQVESTDLDSPELVEKIVARIKRFNFGPKDGVPKVTILYPIDFLPAG